MNHSLTCVSALLVTSQRGITDVSSSEALIYKQINVGKQLLTDFCIVWGLNDNNNKSNQDFLSKVVNIVNSYDNSKIMETRLC